MKNRLQTTAAIGLALVLWLGLPTLAAAQNQAPPVEPAPEQQPDAAPDPQQPEEPSPGAEDSPASDDAAGSEAQPAGEPAPEDQPPPEKQAPPEDERPATAEGTQPLGETPPDVQAPPEQPTAPEQPTTPEDQAPSEDEPSPTPEGTDPTDPAAPTEAAEATDAAEDDPAADEAAERRRRRLRRQICEPTALPENEEALDRIRREMFESVCKSAQWFDGFFGDRRFDEEARETHGRAQLRVVWDEHDELEVDGRFKVRVDLPNLDNRVNAFLGREDEEDFVAGVDEGITFLPDFFRSEGREEWILGLGYRPVGSDRSQTDFDVGVDVDTPLEPFARGRYRHYWLFGDRNLLRAQETLYWTTQRGWGSTTHLDVERPVGDQALVRWGSRVTVDHETEGADWYSGLTLYHGFGPDQAVALTLGADGETDDEVPLHEYGARLTYRRRMLREWFFGELIGGVSWPREDLLDDRQTALHFGFGFEIQFSGEDLGVGRPRRPSP